MTSGTGWWLLSTPGYGGMIVEAQSEFGARCEALRQGREFEQATPLALRLLPSPRDRNRWLTPREISACLAPQTLENERA